MNHMSRLAPATRAGLLAVALASVGAIALPGRPAQASILVPLDLRALAARADRVVVGVVEDQAAHWVDEGHSAIVTDVHIRVRQALAGAQPGEVITVRRLGGSVNGIGMRVYGEASYTTGEEVLVFAERRGDAYWTVGMTQGKMEVFQQGGVRMARVGLAGAELAAPGRVAQSVAPAQPPGPRPLDDVLREVSGHLQALHKGPALPAKVQP